MKRIRRTAGSATVVRQIDEAVELIMADRKAPLPRIGARLDSLLRVAGDLRDLPDEKFRGRLKRDLLSSIPKPARGQKLARKQKSAGTQKTAPGESKPGTADAAPSAAAINPIPEGFHSITPYVLVDDAARFIDFLKQAFGAEEIARVPRDDGAIMHAEIKIAGSMLELADAPGGDARPTPIAIWLFVENVDETFIRAQKAGAVSIHPPQDQNYGNREASVRDPFGNNWYIATPLEDAHWPEELRSITPYLHPEASDKVIDFLKDAFGGVEVARAQDSHGVVHHAEVRIGDSIIAMGDAHGPYAPMPPQLHLYVPDTDRVYRRALAAGAVSIREPADAPYGDRIAGVRDPYENTWWIATRIREVPIPEPHRGTPAEVPAAELPEQQRPGRIMPFLYVDDAEAAAKFYERVFAAVETHRVTQASGKVSHVQIAIGPTNVMVRDAHTGDLAEQRFYASPTALSGRTPAPHYLYVADADAVIKNAISAGAKVVDQLDDQPWGDRCGGIQDPFGHVWFIATPLKSISR